MSSFWTPKHMAQSWQNITRDAFDFSKIGVANVWKDTRWCMIVVRYRIYIAYFCIYIYYISFIYTIYILYILSVYSNDIHFLKSFNNPKLCPQLLQPRNIRYSEPWPKRWHPHPEHRWFLVVQKPMGPGVRDQNDRLQAWPPGWKTWKTWSNGMML